MYLTTVYDDGNDGTGPGVEPCLAHWLDNADSTRAVANDERPFGTPHCSTDPTDFAE